MSNVKTEGGWEKPKESQKIINNEAQLLKNHKPNHHTSYFIPTNTVNKEDTIINGPDSHYVVSISNSFTDDCSKGNVMYNCTL